MAAKVLAGMDGAVLFEGGADLLHVEADEMPDLDVGDLALGLHLAEPTQGRPAVFVEEEFQEALASNKLRRIGGVCFH